MPAFIPSLPLKLHSASPRTSTHKSRSLLQASHQPINNTPCKSAPPSPSRRKALQYLAATLITTPALLQHSAALAASSQKASVKLGPIEESDAYGYSFATPPEGWSRSTASLSSFRVATVFLNEADGDSNINMVVTPVAGDFQKLTSFGTLENVLVSFSLSVPLHPSNSHPFQAQVLMMCMLLKTHETANYRPQTRQGYRRRFNFHQNRYGEERLRDRVHYHLKRRQEAFAHRFFSSARSISANPHRAGIGRQLGFQRACSKSRHGVIQASNLKLRKHH